MKQWQNFLLVSVLVVFVSIYTGRDSLASFVWQKYGWADAALALNRNDAALATRIGNHFFNADNEGVYDRALAKRHYQRALEIDAKALEPLYQLARIDFLRGDFAYALEKADHIAADYPDFKRLHYLRGLIHGYAGNLEKAEADFLAFLEWDPQSWAGHNDLAWVYFKKGDFANVERAAHVGLKSDPNNPWLLTSLGVALLNQGRKTEARAVLSEAENAAEKLTEADWHRSYPGNDPRWANRGIAEMREAIRSNLGLAEEEEGAGTDRISSE